MTTLTDDFNRANSSTLGTASGGFTWTEVYGDADSVGIVSNQANQANPINAAVYCAAADLAGNDNYTQAMVYARGNVSSNIGVCCRSNGVTTYYMGLTYLGDVYLFRSSAFETFTQIGSAIAITESLPQPLKVQAVGSTIKVFWDSVEKISATDTNITTGLRGGFRAGGGVGGTSVIFDAFETADVVTASAALTGTITASVTEADIVAGGKTIVVTLTGDTWVASGGTFDAQRQAIIDGLDSAQSETHGWNAEVRDKEVVSAVVRTSSTVVTITLTAEAAYNITAQETITVTVPASALTGAVALTAAPTFTVDFVPGPTRQNFYVESLGTSTTTSLTYVTKASLTFTPDASSDYWVIASARVTGSTAGTAVNSRLRDVTGSATLRENVYAPRKTTDHPVQFSLDKFTSGGSPGAQQLDIQYFWNAVSGTAEISNATLLVLKADSTDQYAESEGDSSSTSTTLADKATLTFTPGALGDYLIIAAANILVVTSAIVRVVLDQDAGAATYGDCGYQPKIGDVKSWATMAKVTLAAVSHTFKIQFSRVSGSGDATIRNAAILALRLDKFTVAQYAETRARSTTTSGSYQDKATLTFTPTAQAHIVIGAGLADIASSTDNVFWTLDKDGTSQLEHISDSNTPTSPELNYCFSACWLQKQTQAASSTTWKTRYHSESSQTAGFAQSAIAVLDLTEMAPAAGNPWSYYAQMRRM